MRVGVKTNTGYTFLNAPLNIVIEQEADVPCDSLKAVFAFEENFPDISMIFIFNDNVHDIKKALSEGDVVFSGVADETVITADNNHSIITVFARSLAARLTDSESTITTYNYPSFDVIVKRHAAPFGIVCNDNLSNVYQGAFFVKKGSSNYRVLQRFCREFLGTTMRVDHRGHIIPDLFSGGKTLAFDNNNGIPFEKIEVSDNRFNMISQIEVFDEKGYCMTVRNPLYNSSDIKRIRCLNLMENAEGTPNVADRIIQNSNNKRLSVQLLCRDNLLNTLGYTANVNAYRCENKTFYTEKIKYIRNCEGEKTYVKLALREFNDNNYSRGDK